MLWDILAAISQATLTIVASVMVIRWQKGRREKILVTTIILLGCIGMFSSVRGTIEHWAAQNEVAATLEGTDRFAYLCVDSEDLKNRSSQIRLNVYSTGFLDVLEVKFGPFGVTDPNNIDYQKGLYERLTLVSGGRSQFIFTVPTQDYRIELQYKGKLVVQHLKIIDWGERNIQVFNVTRVRKPAYLSARRVPGMNGKNF